MKYLIKTSRKNLLKVLQNYEERFVLMPSSSVSLHTAFKTTKNSYNSSMIINIVAGIFFKIKRY
ncbi:hypothetical protein BBH99_09495 [Chryseobacterium contaminans]|uniref:Uncharacterized protein n=1 Tax=Chryseobacterium contaminans TaxID=1423959 RepID=A0ABX2X454_9FLAO|nr:hypothetical protein BBH99_09495 [Chryseobacterium contaminans]